MSSFTYSPEDAAQLSRLISDTVRLRGTFRDETLQDDREDLRGQPYSPEQIRQGKCLCCGETRPIRVQMHVCEECFKEQS